MALVFAVLLLVSRFPYAHLYCELICQYDSVPTLLALCKLHAWFDVVGESLDCSSNIIASGFK